jgi:hypothetical protein
MDEVERVKALEKMREEEEQIRKEMKKYLKSRREKVKTEFIVGKVIVSFS